MYKSKRWWTELWMGMAEGSTQQYQVIKGMEVEEFWRLYEIWMKKLKAKTEKPH